MSIDGIPSAAQSGPGAVGQLDYLQYSALDAKLLSLMASCTQPCKSTSETIFAFARELLGDYNGKPIMWLMETESGAVSHTHYEGVALEYAARPGYIVTAIYSHRRGS